MTETTERVDRIFKNKDYQSMLDDIKKQEQNRKFCRHTSEHFFDTARIMYIISLEENLKIPKDIIYAAALLHDIGRAAEYKHGIPHEKASADAVFHLLPECGYTAEETQEVADAVLCHREKDKKYSVLGELLYRADKLSRQCFVCSAYDECYWSESKKNHIIIY